MTRSSRLPLATEQLSLRLGLHRLGHLIDQVVVLWINAGDVCWLGFARSADLAVALALRVARAWRLSLHSCRVLRHESVGIETIGILKHVVLLSPIVQNDVAQADISEALRAVSAGAQQRCTTAFHEPHVRADRLIVRGLATVHFLTLIDAHHVLVRVLL